MKAVKFVLLETFEPNPEDCNPYDGADTVEFFVLPEYKDEFANDNKDEILSWLTEEVELSDEEYKAHDIYAMTQYEIDSYENCDVLEYWS